VARQGGGVSRLQRANLAVLQGEEQAVTPSRYRVEDPPPLGPFRPERVTFWVSVVILDPGSFSFRPAAHVLQGSFP
jgi:hypothetical protein